MPPADNTEIIIFPTPTFSHKEDSFRLYHIYSRGRVTSPASSSHVTRHKGFEPSSPV